MLARLIGATGNKKGGAHGPLDIALASGGSNSHHHNHRSSLPLTGPRSLPFTLDFQGAFYVHRGVECPF